MKLKFKDSDYIGVNEIDGLFPCLYNLLLPVRDKVKEDIYWSDKVEITPTEYKARDGFIPSQSNCGGVQIWEVLPKCEADNFRFIDFGDCYEPEGDLENHECDEHCAASLRVWLKFEGIENGVMKFWLYMGGGNNDAPYFRHGEETTYFETEFTAKTLAQVIKNGKIAVNKLLKYMEK